MANPVWLYYLFATLMLVVSAYSLVLLVVTVTAHRPAGWDVDVAHVLMGVSMSGMFVVDWAFGARQVWEVIFAVLLVWFLGCGALSMQRYGVHLSHYLIHAVMSLAMLLMYAFPVSRTSRWRRCRCPRRHGWIRGCLFYWLSWFWRRPSSRWLRPTKVLRIMAATRRRSPSVALIEQETPRDSSRHHGWKTPATW